MNETQTSSNLSTLVGAARRMVYAACFSARTRARSASPSMPSSSQTLTNENTPPSESSKIQSIAEAACSPEHRNRCASHFLCRRSG